MSMADESPIVKPWCLDHYLCPLLIWNQGLLMVIQEAGNQINLSSKHRNIPESMGEIKWTGSQMMVIQEREIKRQLWAGVGQSTVWTAGWRRNVLSLLRHYRPGRLFAKPNRGRTILSQEFEAQRIVNGKRHVTPDAYWTKWGSARTALNRDNCGLMRAQEHVWNYIFIKKIIVLKKKLCRLFLWHWKLDLLPKVLLMILQ